MGCMIGSRKAPPSVVHVASFAQQWWNLRPWAFRHQQNVCTLGASLLFASFGEDVVRQLSSRCVLLHALHVKYIVLYDGPQIAPAIACNLYTHATHAICGQHLQVLNE
jgi:hypothetical protein